MKTYVGVDNGTSGSIGIVGQEKPHFIKTPKFLEQSYTEKKQKISRLTRHKFKKFLLHNIPDPKNCLVVFERPFVNPRGFKASLSAIRCLADQLAIVEDLGLSLMYVDSKQWQPIMLPKGIKGTEQLKEASLIASTSIFPMFEKTIKSQKDGDGILIAEWARRMGL